MRPTVNVIRWISLCSEIKSITERFRERERERQRETETERDRERETYRERDIQRERHTERDIQRERHTERETYRERVGHRFILTDFFFSPPVSLQITAIASLTRETSAVVPKKLLKKELTYLSFKAHFMFIFAAAKASLVIYIKLEVLSDLPWRR